MSVDPTPAERLMADGWAAGVGDSLRALRDVIEERMTADPDRQDATNQEVGR